MKYDGRRILAFSITLMVISVGLPGTAATATSPRAAVAVPVVLTHRPEIKHQVKVDGSPVLSAQRPSFKPLSAEQITKRDAFAKQTRKSAAALSGPWHIINAHSGKCLTIRNISTADNAEAVQWTCDYAAPYNEEWYLEDVYGTGVFWHFINAHSGKCLTIRNISTADNAEAVQWTCDYAAPYNEEWVFEDVYGGIYWHVINDHSGKCLTIRNISTLDYAQAVQWTCDYAAPYNEEWIFQL